MPEGMSIWQGRSVSCDVVKVSGWLYGAKIFPHKAVRCKMKQAIKLYYFYL